jgi:uncharacterized membrane protein YdjX (TVP38/TMEM64 family)
MRSFILVILKILELLPASVLEMVAVALLVIVIGCIIIAFAALLSEVACQRVVRLLNAVAKLNGKDIQEVRQRRNERNK